MKIILVFVSTLDGKITKWGDPKVKQWASKNDQDYFKQLWDENGLIVMGSATFKADHIKPSANHLIAVMTKNPSEYKEFEKSGQLEFTNETPAQLITRFEKKGYKQMMLVGGAHVATSFLKEQLVNELWLTIEPKIFGMGDQLVVAEKLDIELRLISYEIVNEQGTMINKYEVLNKSI